MRRTDEGWRASELGRTAMLANLELTQVYSLARRDGIDTAPGSFVDECRHSAIAGYENARAAWLAGDDAKAAQFIVYAAMLAGLAARDSVVLQRELHSKAGKLSAGKLRPRARQPHIDALRILVAEGLSNAQILAFLGSADAVCQRALYGFPIEVCEPETTLADDGVLHWYPVGGNSGEAQEFAVSTLKKRLSEIRRSA